MCEALPPTLFQLYASCFLFFFNKSRACRNFFGLLSSEQTHVHQDKYTHIYVEHGGLLVCRYGCESNMCIIDVNMTVAHVHVLNLADKVFCFFFLRVVFVLQFAYVHNVYHTVRGDMRMSM